MQINDKVIKILEEEGWLIESESPLELYHDESNSVATGIAAEIVIRAVLESR